MAWVEKRGERYHLNLEFRGQHYSRSLRTKDHKEAEGCRKRVEANLSEVERGRLLLPADADLILFLLSDGDRQAKQSYKKPFTLGELFRNYQGLPEGVKEANTRYTERIHIKSLLRHLGPERLFPSITCRLLQEYVDARSQEEGIRGRRISEATIRKEIGTLSSIWNRWALPKGFIDGPAPTKGLIYRKTRARVPFQTWQQIDRQIARGGVDDARQIELWESLFLTLQEIEELLVFAGENCRHHMVGVMFAFAGHTGARRSEMMRSQLEDFDFTTGMVTIREKKRDRSKDFTFRYVPMTAFLREVMLNWIAVHPGGQLTICDKANVSVDPNMAHHHFRWLLDGSKWEKLRGWHVLRHSFCSNCALKGLDQRIIDAWMGHQTEEMRRRYRHLFPDQQREAIRSVFG
jgi:integrase